MSAELNKLNVNRSWEECRAKIKNLKGDYKKSRDTNSPHSFKYFTLMEKILNVGVATGDDKVITLVSCTPGNEDSIEDEHQQQHSRMDDGTQPVQIEFKIVPTNEIEFGNIKSGGIPIEISPEGNYLIPHSNFLSDGLESTVDVHTLNTEEDHNHQIRVLDSTPSHTHMQDSSIKTQQPLSHSVEARQVLDTEHGTSVIVITTTENSGPDHSSSAGNRASSSTPPIHIEGPSTSKQYPYRDSYTNAGKRAKKSNSSEINHKRRKLHSLSEKMAETVDRVLTRTTNALIREFKASEDRFMEWEEKKRFEEQQREEKLLQSFVNAIRSKNCPNEASERQAAEEEDKEKRERERILSMIQSSDDPCAMTFDLLATRLTTMLNDQQRDTEQTLYQWETKMQKQEMKHTENLFSMIISAVKSSNNEEYL